MIKHYQLQYNRNSGLDRAPDWRPMPEGRGVIVGTRKEAMQKKRDYHAACIRVFGAKQGIELRIASGRYVVGLPQPLGEVGGPQPCVAPGEHADVAAPGDPADLDVGQGRPFV